MTPVGELGECAASAPLCSWLMPARSISSPLDMCRLKVRCCRSLHVGTSIVVVRHCCLDSYCETVVHRHPKSEMFVLLEAWHIST